MSANIPIKLEAEIRANPEKRKTVLSETGSSSLLDEDTLLAGSRPVKMRKEEESLQETVTLLVSSRPVESSPVHNVDDKSVNGTILEKALKATWIMYLDRVWEVQKNLVNAILNNEEIETNFQLVYETCENVCLLGGAEELCSRLQLVFVTYLQDITSSLEDVADKDCEFLDHLREIWIELCEKLFTIQNIFITLDRYYVAHQTEQASLVDIGKDLFKKYVMSNEAIRERTIANILYVVQRHRDGFDVDKKLIKTLLEMLSEYSLYTSHFEARLVADTSAYYNEEATRLIDHLDTPAYLHHVAQRRSEEISGRIEPYLMKTSGQPILEAMMQQLIYTRLHKIITTSFDSMMDNREKLSIKTLYQFVSYSNREKPMLSAAFGHFIKTRGETLVLMNDSSKLVTALSRFKGDMEEILYGCFGNDPLYANALKEGFAVFVNRKPHRTAQLIAKYTDKKLRSKLKSQNSAQVKTQLKTAMVFFRYLTAKDVFETCYKEYFARRLLFGRTGANATESYMVSMLEEECGLDFTKDLRSMLEDMKQAEELKKPFEDSLEIWNDKTLLDYNTDVHVDVLSQGTWPISSQHDIKLPAQFTWYQKAYEAFYTTRFNGRRLTWRSMMGTCKIQANFPLATKYLLVNVPQTVVLLLFNNKKEAYMSFGKIVEATHMDKQELKHVLRSLACGQHRILLKEPLNDDIAETDRFYYNLFFQSPKPVIKIPLVFQEQAVDEDLCVESHVLLERQHQLEAAIVRTLKKHRMMNHSTLLTSLSTQLRFPLNPTDFKARIEVLIAREFITHEKNAYSYKE